MSRCDISRQNENKRILFFFFFPYECERNNTSSFKTAIDIDCNTGVTNDEIIAESHNEKIVVKKLIRRDEIGRQTRRIVSIEPRITNNDSRGQRLQIKLFQFSSYVSVKRFVKMTFYKLLFSKKFEGYTFYKIVFFWKFRRF